jgi:D-3-phosphoglycerate dehydrogenase
VKAHKVGVPNPLFSRFAPLRDELLAVYPDAKVRADGLLMTEDELLEFGRDVDALVIGLEPITERVLTALPNIKIVSKFGAGCDTIDFDAVRKHGVYFGYTAGVNKLDVAELALCFMIAALRNVTPLNQAMRAGKRPRMEQGRNLTGRVVGIHGCGNVGKEVVRLLQPFQCEILACDIADYSEFYARYGVRSVSFDELLARSEVLTLHIPKSKDTIGLYDAQTLAKLRPDCVLINTCRGGIVDEDALYGRLASGALVAACFDAFNIEPATNDALLALPNFLATPHIGAATEVSRMSMGRAAIRGLAENALVREGQLF